MKPPSLIARRQLFGAALACLVTNSGCGGGSAKRSSSLRTGTLIRVACIGDSITYGAGISESEAYPARLNSLLGAEGRAKNLGHPGATLLTRGDLPYRQTAEFSQVVDFVPDTVVIQLGTNDSKEQNWRYQADFLGDATSLISSLQQIPTVRRVYVCLPPPVFTDGAFGIRRDVIEQEITPLLRQAAQTTAVSVIDLHTLLQGKPEQFLDGIHPNAAGCATIAATVYSALTS